MIVIAEDAAKRLITSRDAIDAVDLAFREVSRGQARSFPMVREALLPGPDIYGIKSGLGQSILGLKIGGYWTNNQAHGLTNHQSTTVLTDPTTGCPTAFVSSNYLTGVRTAAACAIGIRELSRPNARVLGLIGAGAQALYHIQAARLVRDFDLVLIGSRSEQSSQTLVEALGAPTWATWAAPETISRQADVLITLTPSRSPIVMRDWIRPGTHISAMGADTRGKHELDIDLILKSSVWFDDWGQASTVGECQHTMTMPFKPKGSLCDLLEGKIVGRTSNEEVTIFDSTGLAIQDLAIAAKAVEAAGSTEGSGIVRLDLGRHAVACPLRSGPP